MTRRRGERLAPHDLRCTCGKFLPANGPDCDHQRNYPCVIEVDEVLFLLSTGASVVEVAQRLGVKVASIERVFFRKGSEQDKAVLYRHLRGLPMTGRRPYDTRRGHARVDAA